MLQGECRPPLETLLIEAAYVLRNYSPGYSEGDKEIYQNGKKCLFEILDLLKKYGADFEKWFDSYTFCGETRRQAYLDEFVPKEDKPYEFEYKGKLIKGVEKGDKDINKEIRAAFQEYFKTK